MDTIKSKSSSEQSTKDFLEKLLLPALKTNKPDFTCGTISGSNSFYIGFIGSCKKKNYRYSAVVDITFEYLIFNFYRLDSKVFIINLSLTDSSKCNYNVTKKTGMPYLDLISHIIKTFKSLRNDV